MKQLHTQNYPTKTNNYTNQLPRTIVCKRFYRVTPFPPNRENNNYNNNKKKKQFRMSTTLTKTPGSTPKP